MKKFRVTSTRFLVRRQSMLKKRFKLEKKMVAVVRYYETIYLIHDSAGERIYTGNDEAMAKRILKALNGYQWNRKALKSKKKKLKRRTRRGDREGLRYPS